MNQSINTPPSAYGSTATINGKLLAAATMTGIGAWLYPSSIQDWGWGFLAIMLWLSSLGLVVEVIGLAVKIYLRDRALSKFASQGHQPKSAEMASSDALQNAGMTDG
ncbi:MAG: hypothetical protein OXR62_16180 [Ahrensia sp.]|nr:hypothetical protein [Ahrensia sp.]